MIQLVVGPRELRGLIRAKMPERGETAQAARNSRFLVAKVSLMGVAMRTKTAPEDAKAMSHNLRPPSL